MHLLDFLFQFRDLRHPFRKPSLKALLSGALLDGFTFLGYLTAVGIGLFLSALKEVMSRYQLSEFRCGNDLAVWGLMDAIAVQKCEKFSLAHCSSCFWKNSTTAISCC